MQVPFTSATRKKCLIVRCWKSAFRMSLPDTAGFLQLLQFPHVVTLGSNLELAELSIQQKQIQLVYLNLISIPVRVRSTLLYVWFSTFTNVFCIGHIKHIIRHVNWGFRMQPFIIHLISLFQFNTLERKIQVVYRLQERFNLFLAKKKTKSLISLIFQNKENNYYY